MRLCFVIKIWFMGLVLAGFLAACGSAKDLDRFVSFEDTDIGNGELYFPDAATEDSELDGSVEELDGSVEELDGSVEEMTK